jgi:uncharacterized membrane protein
MTSRQAWSWFIVAVGVALAFISIFADRIGVGAMPGFGWKQTLGLLVGLALIALGLWRMRSEARS